MLIQSGTAIHVKSGKEKFFGWLLRDIDTEAESQTFDVHIINVGKKKNTLGDTVTFDTALVEITVNDDPEFTNEPNPEQLEDQQ